MPFLWSLTGMSRFGKKSDSCQSDHLPTTADSVRNVAPGSLLDKKVHLPRWDLGSKKMDRTWYTPHVKLSGMQRSLEWCNSHENPPSQLGDIELSSQVFPGDNGGLRVIDVENNRLLVGFSWKLHHSMDNFISNSRVKFEMNLWTLT